MNKEVNFNKIKNDFSSFLECITGAKLKPWQRYYINMTQKLKNYNSLNSARYYEKRRRQTIMLLNSVVLGNTVHMLLGKSKNNFLNYFKKVLKCQNIKYYINDNVMTFEKFKGKIILKEAGKGD